MSLESRLGGAASSSLRNAVAAVSREFTPQQLAHLTPEELARLLARFGRFTPVRGGIRSLNEIELPSIRGVKEGVELGELGWVGPNPVKLPPRLLAPVGVSELEFRRS